MTSLHRRTLLASAITATTLFAIAPAQAACVVGANAVTCATTTTTDTTNAGGTPAVDRHYPVDTSAANFTGTVSTGAIVDGFGLAFTNTVSGTNSLNVVNDGTVQVNAGNTATQGGSAALDISAIGATNVNYSGAGDVFNLGTAGDGLLIDTIGTGNIAAVVGGSVAGSALGSGVNLQHSGTAGSLSVTTTAGETIQAGGAPLTGGVIAQITNAANAGTVTVVNNANVGSLTGAPNTLFVGVGGTTAGTGNIAVTNNGTIGSATDRAQFFALYGANSGTAGNVAVTNGAGSIFGVNGILAQSISSGSIAVSTGSGAVNAVDTGILVNAGGTGNITTVTTGTGAVTASSATGVGINVAGATNAAATTITTGGTVTGGAFGIQAATVGPQTITANGVTTGGTAGIHSNTTAARTINVGTAGNVTGTTQSILIGNTGTAAVNNSGIIGAASTGLAVQATGAGATTVTNNASGTLNGRLLLTANADSLVNAGIFNTQGTTDFGAGADVLNNQSTGTINILGATSFTGLETFTQSGRINLNANTLTLSGTPFVNAGTIDTSGNAGIAGITSFSNTGTLDLAPGTFTVPAVAFTNSGTILADEGTSTITGQTSFANSGTLDLQDGAVGDVLRIESSFAGSGGSNLLVDFNDTASDQLVITGAASGSTTVNANFIGTGLINVPGVLVVDTGSTSANAFVLGTVGGNTSPLVDYSLVQSGSDFFLTAAPTAEAFDPVAIGNLAGSLWYQSAYEVFAQTDLASGDGIGLWGQVYYARDKYGDDDDVATIDGVDFAVDNELKTKRYGIQAGVDYGFGGARIGLTGGYGRADAENDLDNDIEADGWNLGVYGAFGGLTGFHGSFLAKHDRYDLEFDGGAFTGEEADVRSTGVDGSLGYRFGLGGAAVLDAKVGLSHVRTKIDDINAFGFNYDIGKITSTRGRAGVRATFGGNLAPYVEAMVHREFEGDNNVELFDGATFYDIDSGGKGTWARLEAGLAPNLGSGPILAAYADLGDKKGFGVRAGFRFGGRAVEEVLPPPPPPPVIAPPPPPPPPATQTCADGSVILATDACPPPPPPPPPPPEPERG